MTRRRFITSGAAVLAAGVAAWTVDASMEASSPTLMEIQVTLSRWPQPWDGFRVVQLSDFHYDDRFSVVPIRRAIDIVNRLKPDLIALTGDFVTAPLFDGGPRTRRKAAAAIEPCAQLLTKLHARLGSFAVLGNHDVGSDERRIVDVLNEHGIAVLCNRSTPFEKDGKRFWLCGLNDVLEGRENWDLALRGVPRTEPVVLLVHEPDCADQAATLPVDLQLSGHSHGGQIRLPLIGPPYLPPLARKYPWGLRRVGPLTLYTNAGIGTIRVPARFNCPPEITVFILRSAK